MIPERRSRHHGIDLKPIHNVKEALRAVSRTRRLHSGRQSLPATYFLILELRSAATALRRSRLRPCQPAAANRTGSAQTPPAAAPAVSPPPPNTDRFPRPTSPRPPIAART